MLVELRAVQSFPLDFRKKIAKAV